MQFKYTGDPRSDENPLTATIVSRLDPGRRYSFALDGPAVEVHEDDVPLLQGNSHFKPAPKVSAKKKPAKKASKKKTK